MVTKEQLLQRKRQKVTRVSGKRQLGSENVYYAYVLMDTRKPGAYRYKCGDAYIDFSHEPFYVGKGKGLRMYQHEMEARHTNQKSHKIHKIRAILREGLSIRIVKTSLCNEAEALAKEMLLIECIKRRCDGGPLTNYTLGGEGQAGHSPSKETRQRMREAHAAFTEQEIAARMKRREPQYDRVALGEKISKVHRSKPKEWWDAFHAKRLATMENFSQERKALRAKRASESMKLRNKTSPPASVTCPQCGTTGSPRGINKRWHFDNCRYAD